YVSTTHVSIEATCPNSCPHKGVNCYSQAGWEKFRGLRRDNAAAGLTGLDVIRAEGRLLREAFAGGLVPQDGACGGRDLRLHVDGDTSCAQGARLLAEAAIHLQERGAGAIWTFTHRWRQMPRRVWGPAISVLASVEDAADIEAARAKGYVAAITLARFPSTRAFSLPGTTAKIIPCPEELWEREKKPSKVTRTGDELEDQRTRPTCVRCRLCLEDEKLRERNLAIAFELHGPTKKKAAEALVQIHRKVALAPDAGVAP
ncbi:MAG TPA: hypothetical protein VGI39_04605, partial [Polyangiaceae bacterium]